MAHAVSALLAKTQAFFRRNSEITAVRVCVVGPDGKPRGILPLGIALEVARSFGMDLVEVVPNATPPLTCVVGITMLLRKTRGQAPPEDANN